MKFTYIQGILLLLTFWLTACGGTVPSAPPADVETTESATQSSSETAQTAKQSQTNPATTTVQTAELPDIVVGERNLQPQLKQATIPLDDIVTLLPRDAIPAILPDETTNLLVTAEEATAAGMSDDIQVMGITVNGESHAYPIPFMSRHEIVNAEVGGQKIAATW